MTPTIAQLVPVDLLERRFARLRDKELATISARRSRGALDQRAAPSMSGMTPARFAVIASGSPWRAMM
jgi:hypothetical protein